MSTPTPTDSKVSLNVNLQPTESPYIIESAPQTKVSVETKVNVSASTEDLTVALSHIAGIVKEVANTFIKAFEMSINSRQ